MIFGLRKFHQYLYGQKFKILTDYKPLLGLFKADKAVPTMAHHKFKGGLYLWQPATMNLFTERDVNMVMLMVSVGLPCLIQ